MTKSQERQRCKHTNDGNNERLWVSRSKNQALLMLQSNLARGPSAIASEDCKHSQIPRSSSPSHKSSTNAAHTDNSYSYAPCSSPPVPDICARQRLLKNSHIGSNTQNDRLSHLASVRSYSANNMHTSHIMGNALRRRDFGRLGNRGKVRSGSL